MELIQLKREMARAYQFIKSPAVDLEAATHCQILTVDFLNGQGCCTDGTTGFLLICYTPVGFIRYRSRIYRNAIRWSFSRVAPIVALITFSLFLGSDGNNTSFCFYRLFNFILLLTDVFNAAIWSASNYF